MAQDRDKTEQFRRINPILGVKPRIGPFPADQFIPWSIIALAMYLIGNQTLHLGWLWTGLGIAWGVATWWLLTGGRSWRFLSKFVTVPNWTRGYKRAELLLNRSQLPNAQVPNHQKRQTRN